MAGRGVGSNKQVLGAQSGGSGSAESEGLAGGFGSSKANAAGAVAVGTSGGLSDNHGATAAGAASLGFPGRKRNGPADVRQRSPTFHSLTAANAAGGRSGFGGQAGPGAATGIHPSTKPPPPVGNSPAGGTKWS
ncbi:uncharacterized protein LOC133902777 [Phragmites australis]|uniref:uncharacterized protein LOC133902777 n=1 Tax=Phragmites australis TaxID=29695 RepID=UPI002D78C4E7|nr:uncharacterized protein LOC133902777 [Phragmites australis]